MSLVNFWAVFASMILSVVLGFIWYGPLFGKKWMELNNIPMDVKPSIKVMIKPIILSFIGAILMSSVLSFSIAFHNFYYSTSGIGTDISFAFVLWLGFVVPVYLNFVGWEGKSKTLFFINIGYWLVFLFVSASIIGLLV